MKYCDRLDVFNYLGILCSLYGKNESDIDWSSNRLYDILYRILEDTKKVDYEAMRRTVESVLLFGVRISEVKDIVTIKNEDNAIISIVCSKQRLVREYEVNIVNYNKYLYNFFEVENRRTLPKKEAERRVYKYYPYLKSIKYIGIKGKMHFFRHLHITVLKQMLNMSLTEINEFFKWSDLKLVETYILDDSAFKSLPLNTKDRSK